MGEIVLGLLLLAYLFFWMWQFVQLMLLDDGDFPGRSDKILWLVIFIVFCFIAPVVFLWWKKSYLHLRDIEQHD